MPELAELKLTADYINKMSAGLKFESVQKNPEHKCEDLNIPFRKFKIRAQSKGKEIVVGILDCDSDQIIPIRWTMGMSGYFKMTNVLQEPKHSHVKFYTDDGTVLSFIDVRRFGKWKQGVWWNEDRGPDPTTEFLKFKEHIHNNTLNPNTSGREAIESHPEILYLCQDIPMLAYAKGGGSIKDWDNPFGDESIQERFMLCYGNKGMAHKQDRNGRRFWYDPIWDVHERMELEEKWHKDSGSANPREYYLKKDIIL